MPDFFGEIQQQLNDFWQGLESGQKIKLLSVVALSILVLVVGIVLLSKPKYETLYSSLSTNDMVSATKKLDELKISYNVSEDGMGLLVPKSDKTAAKLGLAEANIPKTGSKYSDALSNTKLGTTESDKTRQYNEYKASEIARALSENSQYISSAEVFFNISNDTTFLGENKKSTASVKITPNGELSPSQIDGIARFVANSMQGLDPKDVAVVDNNYNPLKDADDTITGGADKQYTLRQMIKKNQEKEIREMLTNQSTEFDDVKVVSNLKLDFNTEITDAKTLEPVINETGAIINKSEKQEELINGSTGGVPGTTSNAGTTTYPNGTSGNGSSYSNSDISEQYEYNEKVTKSTKALGQVDLNNSTVAVSLYYGKKVEQAPSQEVVNKVINVVSKATGISSDKISVETFQMAKETAQKSKVDILGALQKYGVFGLAVILIGLLAFGVLYGPRKIKIEGMPTSIRSIKVPEAELEEIIIEEKSEVKKHIDKFIKQKPEAVANLLRNWLTEDWE